jgi:DNA-binding transcriptional regulator LsrR (DeoR family)
LILKSGGRGAKVEELLSIDQEYPFQWRDQRVNLAELAKLRWIEGWTRPQLASHYQKTLYAISKYCKTIKQKGFVLEDLSIKEQEKIRTLSKN